MRAKILDGSDALLVCTKNCGEGAPILAAQTHNILCMSPSQLDKYPLPVSFTSANSCKISYFSKVVYFFLLCFLPAIHVWCCVIQCYTCVRRNHGGRWKQQLKQSVWLSRCSIVETMALRILGCLAKANDLIVINVIPFIPFSSLINALLHYYCNGLLFVTPIGLCDEV